MNQVSISIPTSLFVEIYGRYGEGTEEQIVQCLGQLLVDEQPAPQSVAKSRQHFMRPGPGTITGRVWEIADSLYEKSGEMDREAVVAACMDEGIKMNTASTQYSHWKNAMQQDQGES